jgi:hypothetical protein
MMFDVSVGIMSGAGRRDAGKQDYQPLAAPVLARSYRDFSAGSQAVKTIVQRESRHWITLNE